MYKHLGVVVFCLSLSLPAFATTQLQSSCTGYNPKIDSKYLIPFSQDNWDALRKTWGGTQTQNQNGGVTPGETGEKPMISWSADVVFGKQQAVVNLYAHGDNAKAHYSKGVEKNPEYSPKNDSVDKKYRTAVNNLYGANAKRVGSGIVSKKSYGSGTYTIVMKITNDKTIQDKNKLYFAPAIWLFHYEEHYPGDPLYTPFRKQSGDFTVDMGELDAPEIGKLDASPHQANNLMLNAYSDKVLNDGYSGTIHQVVYNHLHQNLDSQCYFTYQLIWKTQLQPLPADCISKQFKKTLLFSDKASYYYLPKEGAQLPQLCKVLTGRQIIEKDNQWYYHEGKSATLKINGTTVATAVENVPSLPARIYIAAWFPSWAMIGGGAREGGAPFDRASVSVAAVYFQPSSDQSGDTVKGQVETSPKDGVVAWPLGPRPAVQSSSTDKTVKVPELNNSAR